MIQTQLVIAIAGFSLSACGFRDSPAADKAVGEGGTASSAGSGAGPSFPACSDPGIPDPRGFAACPAYFDRGTSFFAAGVVVGTTDECNNYRSSLGSVSPDARFAGFEIEDNSSQRWKADFALGSIPETLLMVGESVVLTHDLVRTPAPSVDIFEMRGFVAIEKDGAPVVFFAFGVLPAFDAIPDFAVKPGDFQCGRSIGDECGARRRMRVTANGESVDLAMGESAELAGLELRSGGLADNRTCEEDALYGPPIDYMLAGYRIPD